MIAVFPVRAFQDNYIWLLHDQQVAVVVDPGDAGPVRDFLDEHRLQLVAVLCTHHHWDHVNGIAELVAKQDIPVYGPAAENIPVVTNAVSDGDQVTIQPLGLDFRIIATPGHTSGHIVYYGHDMLFCGDTLFSGGCGRLFEGTAEQMHHSLQTIRQLPADTRVYCAHEYTLSNLDFAEVVEPGNEDTRGYIQRAEGLQQQGQPTLPSTLALEVKINPFLRVDQPAVQHSVEQHAGKRLASETDIFAALRRWKDTFRG